MCRLTENEKLTIQHCLSHYDGRKIERCPFCLSIEKVELGCELSGNHIQNEVYQVECWGCSTRGPQREEWEDAIEKWNEAYSRLQHYINQAGRWVNESRR